MLDSYIGFFAMGWIAFCLFYIVLAMYVGKMKGVTDDFVARTVAFGWLYVPAALLRLVSKRYDGWYKRSHYVLPFAVFLWCLPIYIMALIAYGWAACNSDICAIGLGDFVIGWFK